MKKPSDKRVTAAKVIAGVAAGFTIAANITGCVYGPPQEPTGNNNRQTETTAPSDDVNPDDNINADVYGPPSDFDMDDNLPATEYGPPSDFEVEEIAEEGIEGAEDGVTEQAPEE